MTAFCFVLDSNGQRLKPTKEKKGWHHIRKGKAKLVNKFPMVIQLNKEVKTEEIDSSSMHLGIDDGSKHVGIGLIQDCQTKNKPVVKGTIEHRPDVKHLIDVRRGYRRYKRSHKRYRKPRFHNRSSSKRKEGLHPVSSKNGMRFFEWCEIFKNGLTLILSI